MLKKIDDLFDRINDFGKDFDDVNAFEAAFASSPLNNEYINIFVEIAQKEVKNNMPSAGEIIKERAGDEIKNRVFKSHAVLADERDKAIRDIPIIGDVIDAKQKIDFFNRFKKNKKEE